MRLLIFCVPSFVWPIQRMKVGWNVKSRRLDEITLYDGIRKAIEDAIAQLENQRNMIKSRDISRDVTLGNMADGKTEV